jgi:hypothetical protein
LDQNLENLIKLSGVSDFEILVPQNIRYITYIYIWYMARYTVGVNPAHSWVQTSFFEGKFSYIKSILVASMRVSDSFSSGKWPQFMMNIPNLLLITIVFNQIAILSTTLAVYRH